MFAKSNSKFCAQTQPFDAAYGLTFATLFVTQEEKKTFLVATRMYVDLCFRFGCVYFYGSRLLHKIFPLQNKWMNERLFGHLGKKVSHMENIKVTLVNVKSW